jgi:hypothetical protein
MANKSLRLRRQLLKESPPKGPTRMPYAIIRVTTLEGKPVVISAPGSGQILS